MKNKPKKSTGNVVELEPYIIDSKKLPRAHNPNFVRNDHEIVLGEFDSYEVVDEKKKTIKSHRIWNRASLTQDEYSGCKRSMPRYQGFTTHVTVTNGLFVKSDIPVYVINISEESILITTGTKLRNRLKHNINIELSNHSKHSFKCQVVRSDIGKKSPTEYKYALVFSGTSEMFKMDIRYLGLRLNIKKFENNNL